MSRNPPISHRCGGRKEDGQPKEQDKDQRNRVRVDPSEEGGVEGATESYEAPEPRMDRILQTEVRGRDVSLLFYHLPHRVE